MTIDQIRHAASAEPFIPFTLSLGDGRKIRINHADQLWMPREASRIVVADAPDVYSIIDIPMVVSLDFKKRGSRGRSNGRSNGKQRP